MSARAVWEHPAIEQLVDLARLDHRQAVRVVRAVRGLARDDVGDVRKLEGRKDEWRLRVGDWRVTFTRDAGDGLIYVLSVDNRRDAY